MVARAKITKTDGYKCAPRGSVLEVFPCGSIVDGQVAEWALADHAASAMFNPVAETKITPPAETKAGKTIKRRPRK